jgi:predicted dehydrogenase
MNKRMTPVFRRDFLKGMATLPFLGFFAIGFKDNITKEILQNNIDYQARLGIGEINAIKQKLLPVTGSSNDRLRIGLVGNGWRGESLLQRLGYFHPDFVQQNTKDGKLTERFLTTRIWDDLNVELTGVCDTFEVHARRGSECLTNEQVLTGDWDRNAKAIRIFPTYREMIASGEIDAIVIATPDHTHARMAIEAAKAGIHIFLEKPMTRTIEEAVELRNTIKSTGVVFQLGHENRQQMSFKIAHEMVQKGVLGEVSMVETFTNRNSEDGAWIRTRKFDHLGNTDTINWKEFLDTAPWLEFDPKRYFNWHRYSEYGTSVTGNQFSHVYDCINQILELGIPESVVASGGQYYYKDHGDMPDVMNAIFNYPKRKLTLTYNCSLKNEIYRSSRILGSEATMDIDKAILLYKDSQSQRYKEIKINTEEPFYYYAPGSDLDATTTATSKAYIRGGYGPTFIDGKKIDTTYLHLKEWIDSIRGQGQPSCNIDLGFEEAVTFIMANLAFDHQKTVWWDEKNEKAVIGELKLQV